MYISFFIEVDANKEGKYKEEFLHAVEEHRNSGGYVIASPEYTSILEEKPEETVWEIPAEIMENISANLENSWEREALLVIQRNHSLEQWLNERFSEISQVPEAILCHGEYISVCEAAEKAGIKTYCRYSVRNAAAQSGIHNTISSMQRQMEYAEKEKEELQKNLDGLQEYITSTENYMKELQKHATNLDNQLQEYKAFYDENAGNIERLQQEKQNYLKLYKENLEKLNKVQIEYLDLQQRMGKHIKRKDR